MWRCFYWAPSQPAAPVRRRHRRHQPLDLRNASGEVMLTQQATAESGSEESNFDATITIPADLPGGFYDLVAYDNSAQDGSIQNEFPVQIEVR
ncbi:Gmad2 immunoglobulin-like domain-containing protein [Cryobacterium adonitolivorans]|nr:Gmad2 immunoglobulin-like domain-containing protein [Cryobacterium adonitolivorans]